MIDRLLLAALVLSPLAGGASLFLWVICVGVGVTGMGCTRDRTYELLMLASGCIFVASALTKTALLVRKTYLNLNHPGFRGGRLV
jgi:hypothetical protein